MRGDLFPSGLELSFLKLVKGAAAGFIATAPMSVSMLIGWTLLPKRENYSLPPHLVTEEILNALALKI